MDALGRWAGWGCCGFPTSFGCWSFLPSQKNSSQAGDIFAAVSRVLGQAPLDFWGAELLAGQAEGALGWITINYVLGTLIKVPRAAPGWGLDDRGLWVHVAGSRTQCRLSVLSTPSLENGSGLWRGPWWVPWTWVEPPPRSPLCLEAPYWTRALRPPSASTALSTGSTPTATSVSGVTRC